MHPATYHDPRRRRTLIGAAVLASTSLLTLTGCSRSSAEERLRKRIADMQEALQQQKTRAFMSGIAPDFIGEQALDADGLRQLLRLIFLRHQDTRARLGPLQIQITGKEATVKFKAVLTGGSGGLLPDSAEGWNVSSAWRDGADGWQVFNASWEPVF